MRLKSLLVAPFLLALPGLASAAPVFFGEVYESDSQIRSLSAALDIIANSGGPDATFESTGINYPNGSRNTVRSTTPIADFLGVDGSTLSNVVGAVETTVFRFSGFIELFDGPETISLRSDDGFRLTIDGNVIRENGLRPFRETVFTTELGTGIVPFEFIFFENRGNTGVEFDINGQTVTPSLPPVPLPAGGLLLLSALGGLALVNRRRKTAS